MVARALHDGSLVAKGPFVALNCGAIPSGLVESVLCGHRKGAFTGAVDGHRGVFVSANGGTLFLDEVGELPLALQPALLRVLETGEVRPLGSDRAQRVKVRILAATNRELDVDVRSGRFREDLFFRLSVLRIRVSPLRERVEDIVPLARHFAEEASLGPLPDHVLEHLKARPWPGNVRELRNSVLAYGALGTVPEATRATAALDLAMKNGIDPDRAYAEQKDAIVERFTAMYVPLVLERARGNQTVAAKLAGLDRGYFGRLVARYAPKK
jgi:two-component system NtrC family response regulator